MEKCDLNWWIEKIRKNEIKVPFYNVKNFFLKKLMEDQEKLKKIIDSFGFYMNSLGISGEEFFPITIDVINREKMPGDYRWVGYGESLCVVYYGISPELENFVSLILWPQESKNPEYVNISRKAYRKIHDLVVNDPYHHYVIKLSGNFKLNLPNEIRPYRSEVHLVPKRKLVYDWMHVPFLKEVGETILSHKSPLNFTRAFIRTSSGALISKYINFKTTVGKFIEKKMNIAKFMIIYLSKEKRRPCSFLIHDSVRKKFDTIKSGDLVGFLVGEIVDDKPQATIMDVEKIKSIDVFSHILLYRLYNLYLEKKRLHLMSWNEFEKLFKSYLELTSNFCKGLDDISPTFYKLNTFYEMSLKFFFKKIEDGFYYIPSILNGLSNEDVKLFDERLYKGKENLFETPLAFDERGYIRKDTKELTRKYTKLRFILEIKSLIYKGNWDVSEASYETHFS